MSIELFMGNDYLKVQICIKVEWFLKGLRDLHLQLFFKTNSLQLMVDTVTMETGQTVLLNVEEELRQEPEPAQTLLLHTEELTV